MTTPSSALPQGVRDNFDIGPLSWVMGEIREALNRSRTAIHDAVSQDEDAQSTSMRHAKSYLHQAHGALQIRGVALPFGARQLLEPRDVPRIEHEDAVPAVHLVVRQIPGRCGEPRDEIPVRGVLRSRRVERAPLPRRQCVPARRRHARKHARDQWRAVC